MTDRGLSTVVDVAVCILLIGASVATLATATPPPTTTGPDPTPVAVVLGTATQTAAGRPGATLADRLAGAAIATTQATPAAVTTVRTRVNATLESIPGHTQVVAVWRPYRGAPTIGCVTAGETPPPSAVVATARLTIPISSTITTARLRTLADSGGYAAVATALARATLAHRTRRCDGLDAVRQACTPSEAMSDARVQELAARYETGLRRRFDTPRGAVPAVTVDHIMLIVRRWTR
ncbi:MAG: hypothetical protein ABEJ57_00135 [Halobacteriaceae archaeon]